jgi:drug/metabolite transporter (DMT)-like permease
VQQAADKKVDVSPGPVRFIAETFGNRLSLPALGAQLIWGLNVSTMKITIVEMDAYLVGMVRNMVAGLILLVVLVRLEGRIGLAWQHWPRMFLVALVGMGLNTMLWQTGLSKSTATNAALISSVSPIFALIMALAIGQEILVRRRVIGMLLALAGVVLVIQTDGLTFNDSSVVGDLLLVGCAGTWAAYNVMGVPLLRFYSPLKVTTWAMLLGSIAMALFSPLVVNRWDVSHASAMAWFGVVYAIVFGTVFAQTLWTRALHVLGASSTMIYSYLSPVLAVAFASVLLAERLSPAQVIGAVLVLAGVTLSNGFRRRRA